MTPPLTIELVATRSNIALTHRGVEALRPLGKAYRIPDLRCPGLALRVATSGLKTWDVAYRIRRQGTYRRLSLGPFPAVGLDAARERAKALTDAAKAGRDLLKEEDQVKVAAEARLTVAQIIEAYLSRRVRGRLRTANEIERRFKRTFNSLENRYADEIRRRDLRAVLDKVIDRGKPREAQQQRQIMRVLFRWATSQDFIENDPSAGIASFGSSPRRERILSADEIQVLWNWFSTSKIPPDYLDALKVQLAIGARIGEVAGMCASEIDRENWLWTLPPERSKNGRKRVTPLVGIAREIIEQHFKGEELAFFRTEAGRTLTSNCVASMLVKRRTSFPIAHFTSHDLRRTVATGLVDLGFSFDVVAAILGHEAGSKEVRTLVRHYVRSDLVDCKRTALEAWDSHLRQLLSGAKSRNRLDFVRKRFSSLAREGF